MRVTVRAAGGGECKRGRCLGRNFRRGTTLPLNSENFHKIVYLPRVQFLSSAAQDLLLALIGLVVSFL